MYYSRSWLFYLQAKWGQNEGDDWKCQIFTEQMLLAGGRENVNSLPQSCSCLLCIHWRAFCVCVCVRAHMWGDAYVHACVHVCVCVYMRVCMLAICWGYMLTHHYRKLNLQVSHLSQDLHGSEAQVIALNQQLKWALYWIICSIYTGLHSHKLHTSTAHLQPTQIRIICMLCGAIPSERGKV